MKETAYILQNVSHKCLVIMDELGRGTLCRCGIGLFVLTHSLLTHNHFQHPHSIGTSTHDGLGIAYAVCEELIQIKPIVFFATHFQELAHTLEVYHNVVNMHLETEVNETLIHLFCYLGMLCPRTDSND